MGKALPSRILIVTAAFLFCLTSMAELPDPPLSLDEAAAKARDGDPAGFYSLALHQAAGKLMKKNREKACALLLQAVRAGYPPALYAYASARESRLKEERSPSNGLWMEIGVLPWDLLPNSYKEESLLDEDSAKDILDLYQRAFEGGVASASNALERVRGKIVKVREMEKSNARSLDVIDTIIEGLPKPQATDDRPQNPHDPYFQKPVMPFEKAAEMAKSGDAEAYYSLAIHYAQGKIVERDRKKAYAFLEKAANGNHPTAIFFLGCVDSQDSTPIRKATGLTVYDFKLFSNNLDFADETFYNRILALFKRAGELGVGETEAAIKKLDQYHEEAVRKKQAIAANVEIDRKLSELVPDKFPEIQVMPFEAAVDKAKAGDAAGLCSLAIHYAKGEVVKGDADLAMDYLEKAAAKEYPQALLLLGAVLCRDYFVANKIAGVSPWSFRMEWNFSSRKRGEDSSKALEAYRRAVAAGLPQATNAIARLEGRIEKERSDKENMDRNEALARLAGLIDASSNGKKVDEEKMEEWFDFFHERMPDHSEEWIAVLSAGTNVLAKFDAKIFTEEAIADRAAEYAIADGYRPSWIGGGTNSVQNAAQMAKVAIRLNDGSMAKYSGDGRLESLAPWKDDPWVARASREVEALRKESAAAVGLSVESCKMLAEWLGVTW